MSTSNSVQMGGEKIPLDGLPQTFVYASGFLSTITVEYRGVTYVQTFTNDGTNITNISKWVQQ